MGRRRFGCKFKIETVRLIKDRRVTCECLALVADTSL
jgi:hypothetical protein